MFCESSQKSEEVINKFTDLISSVKDDVSLKRVFDFTGGEYRQPREGRSGGRVKLSRV